MQLRRDHPVVRTLGVFFGIAILALGLGTVLGLPETETVGAIATPGRGLALLLAGIATILASLAIPDPTTIF